MPPGALPLSTPLSLDGDDSQNRISLETPFDVRQLIHLKESFSQFFENIVRNTLGDRDSMAVPLPPLLANIVSSVLTTRDLASPIAHKLARSARMACLLYLSDLTDSSSLDPWTDLTREILHRTRNGQREMDVEELLFFLLQGCAGSSSLESVDLNSQRIWRVSGLMAVAKTLTEESWNLCCIVASRALGMEDMAGRGMQRDAHSSWREGRIEEELGVR